MLAPLLKASGYDVTLAASARRCLALKDKGASFDLIVSDLDMPGMDGIALAERIKADPAWGKIPLIALSSHSNPLPGRTVPGGGIRQLCRQVRPADADGHAARLLQTLGSGGMSAEASELDEATEGFVTVVTGGQLFGLRLERVRDVFVPRGLSQVPLAPPEVAGSAQSARPHRHGHRSSPPARPAAARATAVRRSPSASRNAASFTA